MSIAVAIIGAGAIALANHARGLSLAPEARLVALCDTDAGNLARAAQSLGVKLLFDDPRRAVEHDGVDAVIIATPNFTHPPIVRAAIAAGKHVLCEKPLALDYPTAHELYTEAEAAGIRHMTAFTYRFVPAMRYMHQLVQSGMIGVPWHFRTQRFQDWGRRSMGWRQVKQLCGTGELSDMLSHRIDYGHLLIGPIRRLVANLRNHVPERGGKPSDVDDWVGLLCEFESGPSGMLESTKLATGRGEGYGGEDNVEINGSEGTIVYSTQRPLELRIGKAGQSQLETVEVPRELSVWPGSSRDPDAGDARVTFRYDQNVEFIRAIAENRPCQPGFAEGAEVQLVMDAAELSARERRWVELDSMRIGATS